MKPRHKRFAWIGLGGVIVAVAVTLVLRAFQSNLVFFYTPSQVAGNEAPQGKPFRLGGLVTAGSVVRADGASGNGLNITFSITDTAKTIPVAYTGLLPDLFKEGKGVVAQGRIGPDGVFHASEVLAKHDENYMPPEAAEALKKAGYPIEASLFAGQKGVATQPAEKK
jgi:cytochrome c-type biogenesis protein CcmE